MNKQNKQSIQKDQFCNEIINSAYIHHLQYVELSKSLSEIFSMSFDKEIADLSIALYRLHKKLIQQMQKDPSNNRRLNKTRNQTYIIFGKIKDDFFYYSKLGESLSRIYPSSKYEAELAEISKNLQKLYEKVTLELKSCNSFEEVNCYTKQEEETKFG